MENCKHCNGSKTIPLFSSVSACPWCVDEPSAKGGTVAEYMAANPGTPYGHRPGMLLGDGSTVSVQASEMHYCTPRRTGLASYTDVEVGFPEHANGTPWGRGVCPEMADFEDGAGSHVYGYVPLEVLEAVVARHGGVVGPRPS